MDGELFFDELVATNSEVFLVNPLLDNGFIDEWLVKL